MRRPISRVLPVAAVAFFGVAAIVGAVTIQVQDVRITALSQVMPYKLPRVGTAPIAVFVAGHLENPHGGVPPQLQRLMIEVNRRGLLQSRGLPVCRLAQIESVTTERAVSNCGPALVGSGQFWASIVFSGQEPYPTRGRLLVFNGRINGKPAIFAHIYTANPFNSAFVIPFALRHIARGEYGTRLTASLPQALGSWGYLNRIKLTLKREYSFKGERTSYFNAGCPAPAGADRTPFHLARATFSFRDRPEVVVPVVKSCGVRRGS